MSNTFLWIHFITAGFFFQCTPTLLLMTTVYLYNLLWFERLLSCPCCLHSPSPTYSLILANPTLPNFSSTFLALFSHLHLIMYARMLKFLCSVAVLTFSISLSAVSSLICDHLLFRSSSLHLCVPGHFNNRWDLFSCTHKWHLCHDRGTL